MGLAFQLSISLLAGILAAGTVEWLNAKGKTLWQRRQREEVYDDVVALVAKTVESIDVLYEQAGDGLNPGNWVIGEHRWEVVYDRLTTLQTRQSVLEVAKLVLHAIRFYNEACRRAVRGPERNPDTALVLGDRDQQQLRLDATAVAKANGLEEALRHLLDEIGRDPPDVERVDTPEGDIAEMVTEHLEKIGEDENRDRGTL